mgnify:FL=1
MNAKGRAFWERVCFSTRHNSNFSLEGKLGIIIGVSGNGDSNGVIKDIKTFYSDAKINIVDKVEIQGEYACFTCGYGESCTVGGLAKLYDLPMDIKEEYVPDLCNQHPEKGIKEDIRNNLKNVAANLNKSIK